MKHVINIEATVLTESGTIRIPAGSGLELGGNIRVVADVVVTLDGCRYLLESGDQIGLFKPKTPSIIEELEDEPLLDADEFENPDEYDNAEDENLFDDDAEDE
jgi:hypothetical protein